MDKPRPRQDWLSRALARAGVLPQREAEEAIAAGRVRVGGKVARQPLMVVKPHDRITLDGKPVSLKSTTRAVMFHKPAGSVTATTDREKVITVFELLHTAMPEEMRGFTWHAVGRLDRNTTGLLLFTNDEALVTHATAPETHLSKRYLAKVSGKPDEEKVQQLMRGVELEDGEARAKLARMRSADEIEVTLTEGRNHQVKRMLGALGMPVLQLHREAIAKLELDVPLGELRELSPEEIEEKLLFRPR